MFNWKKFKVEIILCGTLILLTLLAGKVIYKMLSPTPGLLIIWVVAIMYGFRIFLWSPIAKLLKQKRQEERE